MDVTSSTMDAARLDQPQALPGGAAAMAAADMTADRRLILRFLAVWSDRAAGREMPALQDFTAAILTPFKTRSLVIDLQEGPEAAVIRHVGDDIIREDATAAALEGQPLAAVPGRSLPGRLTAHAFEVLANRAPIGFEAEFDDAAGQSRPYRGILAPLSRDGETIDFLIGVLSWRETARETATADDQASRLADDLALLRDMALTAGRARAALYDLLARIHGFALAGRAAPDQLAALLAAAGIRAQKRAPETAILKLVFGAGHDKTRLTEYAAALALAARENLDADGFRARLAALSGGLKAMVRAERDARSPGNRPQDRDESAAANPATVRAVIADWRETPGPAGQPLRLMARATGDGRIEILGLAGTKGQP